MTTGQPVTDSAGTARTYVGANELKSFSAAARNALRQMQQGVDRTEVLSQLGELLIEHSRCRLVFEAKIPVELSVGSTESDSEASLQTVANSFPEIPANLPQWAFSAATRAATTGETVLEDADDTQSGPVSLVATLLPAENENSSSLPTVLVAIFVGATSQEAFPFIQMAELEMASRDELRELQTTKHLAADIACLQAISTKASDADSLNVGCRRMVNNLQEHLASITQEQVTVYLGTIKDTKFPNLAAVSQQDSLPSDKSLVESIEATMAECLSRNSETSWPIAKQNAGVQNDFALMCHKKLSEQTNDNAIATYRLIDGQGDSKAMLLVQSESPLDRRANNLLTTSQSQLGVVLGAIERGEKNWLRKFIQTTQEAFATKRTRIILSSLAAIAVLGMLPMPYMIKTTTEIQPAQKKYIYAPFDAPLKESIVEPGDIIQAGAELARLDDRELQLELTDIDAQLHRAQKQMDGFVASHETGEAQLSRHEIEMLVARRDLLLGRVEQVVLKSPVDGIVISGDWKNSGGIPLETGQSLYEVAPLEKLSVDVFVPEDDVRYAAAGQAVTMKFDAYPFESFKGQLKQIHPASEIQNNENVFVATVELDNPELKLRPGMKGHAKCRSDRHSIWWNLLHKPAARCLRYLGW